MMNLKKCERLGEEGEGESVAVVKNIVYTNVKGSWSDKIEWTGVGREQSTIWLSPQNKLDKRRTFLPVFKNENRHEAIG